GVDIDRAATPLGALLTGSNPQQSFARTMLPVPLAYPGMPNPRWWTFEDGKTNFGAIEPDTTDIAKLLFVEFGLVFSNDWYVVPFTLSADTIARIDGIVVTNTFGERFWVDAAGTGPDETWQRWSMFTISPVASGSV